jgi:hypothetical protein
MHDMHLVDWILSWSSNSLCPPSIPHRTLVLVASSRIPSRATSPQPQSSCTMSDERLRCKIVATSGPGPQPSKGEPRIRGRNWRRQKGRFWGWPQTEKPEISPTLFRSRKILHPAFLAHVPNPSMRRHLVFPNEKHGRKPIRVNVAIHSAPVTAVLADVAVE